MDHSNSDGWLGFPNAQESLFIMVLSTTLSNYFHFNFLAERKSYAQLANLFGELI